MEHITYTTKGTCSRQIDIDVENGVIAEVKFTGGCSGNTQGVSALVKGMTVEEAISALAEFIAVLAPRPAPISSLRLSSSTKTLDLN